MVIHYKEALYQVYAPLPLPLTIPDQHVLKEKAKCTSIMSSNQPLLISSTLGRRARRRKYHCCLRRMASDLRLSQLTLVLIATTHARRDGQAELAWAAGYALGQSHIAAQTSPRTYKYNIRTMVQREKQAD